MLTLLADARFALRMLLKSPGFTLTAVLTLALGIGANTAVFTMLDSLMFKPLPGIERPGEMVWLSNQLRSGRSASMSYLDVQAIREGTSVFREVIAYEQVSVNLGSGGEPERINGLLVTGNYFSTLGVRMARGRGFVADEDRTPLTHPVVVIADRLWRRRFSADPGVIGREIVVNGHAFTVIGVTPPEFTGTEISDRLPELFLPLMTYGWAAPSWPNPFEEQAAWMFRVMGRLKSGATLARAEAELTALASRLKREDPDDRGQVGLRVSPLTGRVHAQDRGDVVGLAAIGLGVAAIVLLVSCANVANLLLGRAASRRREVGIRIALGAPRARLIRQLLTESLVLACVAGLAAVLLSAWVTDALVGLVGLPFTLDLGFDLRVLAAALAASIVASVAFGLAPALTCSAEAVVPALADGSPGAGRPRRSRLQRAFVVSEVALSLVLVVSAGLLLRSLSVASALERGYDASDRVLAVSLDIGAQGYGVDRRVGFVRELLDEVAAIPGVQDVAAARLVPMGGRMWGTTVSPEGSAAMDAGRPPLVFLNGVWPGFFRTVGMSLVAGRDFADRDRSGAPLVAIVNERLAKLYWPGQNPIGRRLRFGAGNDVGEWMTVIGVARDATYDEDGEEVRPFLFTPWLQTNARAEPVSVSLLVRVGGDRSPVVAAIRRIVRRMDASLPLYDVTTLGEVIRSRLEPRHAASVVLNIFGGLALVIAAVGLYGVMAFAVAARRREIGVRVALGATGGDVMRLVAGEGLQLVAIGTAVGVLLSVAATRVIAGALVGVSPLDPITFAGAIAALAGSVLVACYLPMRRATRVDPVQALRAE